MHIPEDIWRYIKNEYILKSYWKTKFTREIINNIPQTRIVWSNIFIHQNTHFCREFEQFCNSDRLCCITYSKYKFPKKRINPTKGWRIIQRSGGI